MKPDLAIMVSTGYPGVPEGFAADVQLLGKSYSEVDLSYRIEAAFG
jgi:hypothetical protein